MATVEFIVFKTFVHILFQYHKFSFYCRDRAKDLEEELERTIRSYENQVFFCFVTTSMPVGEMLLQLEHHLLLACELYLAWLFWVSNFASCSLFLMSSGFDNFIAEIMG